MISWSRLGASEGTSSIKWMRSCLSQSCGYLSFLSLNKISLSKLSWGVVVACWKYEAPKSRYERLWWPHEHRQPPRFDASKVRKSHPKSKAPKSRSAWLWWPLGTSWGRSGPPSGCIPRSGWAFWDILEASGACPGAALERLGRVLEAPWKRLGRIFGHLGGLLVSPGAV